MRILVEGFTRDALAVARLLATDPRPEGHPREIRLAGPGPGPDPKEADELHALGVRVDEHADLDADPGAPDLAYMDVWTPETAPRVRRLREAGARLTCLGDLLLERSPVPAIGVTGTAGKTTTTGLLAHLLRAAGVPVIASDASPNANMWPAAEHLAQLPDAPPGAWLLLELTSSHLAFMARSPHIAVITTFWPDHLELHGSLDAYRSAKETIVRHQRPGDIVVVNDDDPAVRAFAELTPAHRYRFSLHHPVAPGAHLDGPDVVLAPAAPAPETGTKEARAPRPGSFAFGGARAANVVAACAAALAAGVPPAEVAAGLADLPEAPFRARPLAHPHGTQVIDDGMAATPGKTRATLASLPEHSAVVLCGGEPHTAAGAVHASDAEREQLGAACREIARVASAVVVFGGAADLLTDVLERAGITPRRAAGLEEAVDLALQLTAQSDTLVFSPVFPVPAPARAAFAELIARRSTQSRTPNP